LCELRTYFYQFFDAAPVSYPSPELEILLAVDREGFSLSNCVLIQSYLPVIDPSSPAGGEGYFPQQFQHSTPTTPLKEWIINWEKFSYINLTLWDRLVVTISKYNLWSTFIICFIKEIFDKKWFVYAKKQLFTQKLSFFETEFLLNYGLIYWINPFQVIFGNFYNDHSVVATGRGLVDLL
jgi:hypothetical protein